MNDVTSSHPGPVRANPRAGITLRTGLTALALFWLAAARAAAGAEDAASCVLVEKEGKVEFARKGSATWSVAQVNESLRPGDKLRTGSRSRAALRWSELSVVRVNELTSLEIQPPAKAGDKPQLDLRSGATYFFSREKPTEVQFRTPVASGAIRGTEFNLEVAEDGRTVLSLLDGEVDLSNAQGAASLGSGQQGTVEPGSAPKKTALINAINVIQWALYYPAVIEPDELGLSAQEKETFKASLDAYRAGDLLGALGSFPENATMTSDAARTLHAALLLAAGRVDQTESELKNVQASSPHAAALREVIAAVKHQPVSPLAPPTTAGGWLARSYYFQSRGELSQALHAARLASVKAPHSGAAQIRYAELEFSFGRTDTALAALNQGLELSPRNAAGLALKGFMLSAKNQFGEAMKAFDQAIAADGALANAWLGRGLVKIRLGMDRKLIDIGQPAVAAGREDLQVAATLEPQRAALRSYLGKAFSQARDLAHARKELNLAQKLDPNDPTSWLYMALLDQQGNRINEAVEDLEKSKELNDNRSVFRSRLLLDQDEAVRAANLAAMYRDDGMFERSVQEAARAVNNDYGNYSAHLFLANSYDTVRDPNAINLRYETPWFSELLLADLLMPINGGNLSQNISQQEYSKLFASDGLGIFSSTLYTSHGDWVENGSQYGVFGNFSYAIDGYYRSQNGFRPNNDIKQTSVDGRFKQQLTDKDSIFFQVGYFSSDSGDMVQYYDQAQASKTFRAQETQEPSLLVGYHREWSPGNHTLFLFSRIQDTLKINDSNSSTLVSRTIPLTSGTTTSAGFLGGFDLGYQSDLNAYSTELQQIWQTHANTLIAGGRYQFGWADTTSGLNRPPPTPISEPILVDQNVNSSLNRLSFYAYDHWQVLDSLRLSAGVTYDRLHYPRNIDTAPITTEETTTDQVSPKAGFLWSPWKETNLRFAYSKSLGGVFFDQSVRLEPVQLEGFTTAFRNLIPDGGLVPATGFQTFGLAVDHHIKPTGTYLMVQGEILNSDGTRTVGLLTNDVASASPLSPDQPSSTPQSLDFQEKSLLVAVNQLIGRDLALGATYKATHADLNSQFYNIPNSAFLLGNPNQDVSALLNQLDLFAIYQHPCGFFARFDALWSQQSNHGYSPDLPGDNFWQFNIYAGYRFLQRRCEARLGLVNMTDRDYKLNPLTLYNELPRERMLTVSFKFQF
jgi:tetratricopeptide (TPR) repeat protein